MLPRCYRSSTRGLTLQQIHGCPAPTEEGLSAQQRRGPRPTQAGSTAPPPARAAAAVSAQVCDNDISAFTGKRRPDYERMLDDIQAGRITGVIAWHPDRLHRRMSELDRYITLCDQHHVENQTVTAGQWDLSTATGKMIARHIGTAATFESEHKSERLRAACIQQAAAGKLWRVIVLALAINKK